MLLIGFSTGAVALGDFERALVLMRATSMNAVELSALRLPELPGLIAALPRLNLKQYSYVSFHAPSRFAESEEGSVIELLQKVPKNWPIILHPDTIYDSAKWREFGSQLAIENLDRRKELGRSAEELKYWFEKLPEARLCLDLAHVHQFDRTMTEAYRILKSFKLKVCQLHVSELDSTGHHHPLSLGSMRAFAEIESMIPLEAAIVLESLCPLSGAEDSVQVRWIEQEAQRACQALRRNEQNLVPTGSSNSFSPLDRALTV
jgi:hypothetical protein